MKTNHYALITILTAFVTFCGCSDRAPLDAAIKSLTEANLKVAALQTRLDQTETNLNEVRIAFQKSSTALAQAQVLIADFQKAMTATASATAEKEKARKLLDAVPSIQTADGITFPQLLSPSGGLLMTNASYVNVRGQKVSFKSGPAYAAAFNVDELHPAVLARLQIDPARAQANQAALDDREKQMRASLASAANNSFQARAQWQEKFNKEQASIAAQQAKDDEVRRQQQVVENQRQQEVNNDSMRARASMIEAIRPY